MSNTVNLESDVTPPLYGRIETYTYFFCCGEPMARCPDGGISICVFCMDECECCMTPIF